MWRKLFIVCMLGAAACSSAQSGNPVNQDERRPEERRFALVVGNGDYEDDPLRNPSGDARAMEEKLLLLGFDVVRHEDATAQQLKDAIHAFNRRLASGGVGVFYFAGHGFQLPGKTMLAPVDADRRFPANMVTKSIDLRILLEGMAAPRPGRLNLVILDTCLNNPFLSGENSSLEAPDDTLIAYATAPGTYAADGPLHGVFTAELLKALAAPGLDIRKVLQHVTDSVRRVSGGQQVPHIVSALHGEAHILAATQPLGTPPAAQDNRIIVPRSRAILPKDSAEQYELAFWDSIKDSNHAADYEAYLQAYPKGRFAALARARIERLRAAAPKAETPAPAPATKAPERPRPAPTTKAAPERPRPAEKEPPQARPEPAEKEAPKQATPAPAASPPAARSSGGSTEEIRDCPACPVLVSLPGGAFSMGSNSGDPSEKPAHRVSISAPFAIGKFEVTVEQWNACVDTGGCPRITNGANQQPKAPVREVSWDDAQQYVQWLTKVSGKPYRLPTEAEWEYAARGGTTTRFWWGDQMRPGNANCKECGDPWSQDAPANVGSFAPNPFGLHDVNGSVWEWVADCWHNSYKGAPDDGRAWETATCPERVIRGGSWREGASYMPPTTRFKYAASVRQMQNGFRVARDMK